MDIKLKIMKREGLSPRYWCTTDDLAPFFNISYSALNALFVAQKVPSHPARCFYYYYKFYFRPAAIKAIQDLRKTKRKGKLKCRRTPRPPVLKKFPNKERYISLKDAAALYGITLSAVDYRISKTPHNVRSVLYCTFTDKGTPHLTKFYDKVQLDAAMSYFLSHKYSVTGRVRLAKRSKYDRMKSDVQSWGGKGRQKRALLEHLGLDSSAFLD